MRRLGIIAIGSLFLAQSAAANPTWSLISFTATPQDAPKILKAADKLMQSEAGQQFPGKLLLLASLADGNDPATHSFVPIYASTADREQFVAKLQADRAWDKFTKVMARRSTPASTTLYRTVKSWGELSESDTVWMTHAFQVSDPAKFLSAVETFMGSSVGREFPGQVYLSGVVAGGGPVSHVISVGYASETEMDAWLDVRNGSPAWARYLRVSQKVSTYLGGNLARQIKSWGPATLSGIMGR